MNQNKSLLSLLTKSEVPQAKGLVHFYDRFALRSVLTKGEILNEALTRAGCWKPKLRPGEPVLIALENGEEFIFAFFGLIAAGAVPVPVSPHADLEPFIRKLGGRFVVSESKLTAATKLEYAPGTPLRIDEAVPYPIALIQFSSGSTSEPKGVMLTHEAILQNLAQIKAGMAVTSKDVLCGWLPFFHDMGLIGCILSPLYNDVACHLMAPKDFIGSTERWLRNVENARGTIILGPNFLYRQLCEKIKNKGAFDLSCLRLALCGAEPVSGDIGGRFISEFSVAGIRPSVFFPVYGLAEASLAVAFPKLEERFSAITRGGREIVSCGFPLPGTEIFIAREDGQFCDDGEEGRIIIRGPSLFQKYFGEASQGLGPAGFDTGDLGFFKNGQLYVTGRAKELMIVRGRKLHPADVEQAIARDGGISEKLAAFSVFNPALGEEQIFVAVEAKRPRGLWDLDRKIMDITYGKFQVPVERVYVVPPQTLPRTTSGKIKRHELAVMHMQGRLTMNPLAFGLALARHHFRKKLLLPFATRAEAREERRVRHALSSELRGLFAEVLGIPAGAVQPDRPFSEYKMDSVAAVQLNAQLKEQLADVPLADFIGFKCLNDVERYLLAHHRKEIQTKFAEAPR
ncbi:MAG TPA: non-ribosomal peptide synthetase [Bdellovibrionales bacterium]|nr:non-ribosomal peptide synthetase [Bdellovibrionales bacterium]